MAKGKKQLKGYSDFSPKWVSRLWIGFAVVLLLTLVAELFVHLHGHFGIAETPFFHAWFGFAACAAIVVVSNLLGKLLKRPENYWEDRS